MAEVLAYAVAPVPITASIVPTASVALPISLVDFRTSNLHVESRAVPLYVRSIGTGSDKVNALEVRPHESIYCATSVASFRRVQAMCLFL